MFERGGGGLTVAKESAMFGASGEESKHTFFASSDLCVLCVRRDGPLQGTSSQQSFFPVRS